MNFGDLFRPLNQRRAERQVRPPSFRDTFKQTIRRIRRGRKLSILGRDFKYFNRLNLQSQVRRSFGVSSREGFQVVNVALSRKKQKRMVYMLRGTELQRQDITLPLITNDFAPFSSVGRGETELETAIVRASAGVPIRTSSGTQIQRTGYSSTIPIRMSVNVSFDVNWSSEWETRDTTLTLVVAPSQLSNGYIANHLLTKTPWGKSTANQTESQIRINDYTFSPFNQGNEEFGITDGVLERCSPINITGLFNEIVDINDKYKCCRDYVKYIWSKKPKNKKRQYYYAKEVDKCRTTDDFYKLCKKKNIKMIVYDIFGRVIKKYYQKEKNKNNLKSLVYIQYNNHIYPVNNKSVSDATNYLRKYKSAEKFKFLPKHLVHKKYIDLWNKGILPTHPRIKFNKVVGFDYEDTHYSSNGEYKRCKAILDKFGMKNHAHYGLNLCGMSNILDKLYYGMKECSSFFPESDKYVKGGFLHINSKFDEHLDGSGKVIACDSNKAYSDKLQKLPYCIVLDIRKSKINKNPRQEIKEHYLYVVEVPKSTIILPNNNIYTGLCCLMARKKNIPFTIKYSYSTIKTERNPYKNFVRDIYEKANPNDAKMIINCMVGKFERSMEMRRPTFISKVCELEEAKATPGFIGKLQDCDIDMYGEITNRSNEPLGIFYGDNDEDIVKYNKDLKEWKDKQVYFVKEEKEEDIFNLFNKKPIAIQVKDQARMDLYEFMEALDLRDEDIYYIKTDCVAFKKGIMTDYLLEDFIGKGLGKWKYEKLKDMTNKFYIPRNLTTIKYKCSNEKNTLYDCNAGAGKTYKVINEIIPQLIKDGEDYEVLAPQHSALREYRLKEIDCNVIAHYTFKEKHNLPGQFPTAKNIIIDEWGMLGHNELMYVFKLNLKGKNIIALGDYDQLLPVGSARESIKENMEESEDYHNTIDSAYNGQLWLDLLFSKVVDIKKNYRNNFTPEYYESLKNGSNDYIQEQMKIHRTHWKEADTIITYRHKYRHMYNALKCSHLDIPFRSVEPGEIIKKGRTTHQEDNKINKNNFALTLIDPKNIKVGTKLICNTNKFKAIGLYNKYIVEVKEVGEKKIVLVDAVGNDISITLTKLLSCSEDKNKMAFSFAYTRTLYSIQGESINGGIYFPDEELYFLNNRACYTLISRKKEDIIHHLTPLPQKKRGDINK